MTRRMNAALGLTLAMAIGGSPVSADVTPQQVWDNFQTKFAPFLPLDDPNEFRRDGRPEIDFRFLKRVTETGDVQITEMQVASGKNGDRITAELGDMTLTGQDDGTVLITFSGDASFSLWDGDKPLNFDIGHQDFALRVGGDPDALSLDLNIARLTVDLDDPRYPSVGVLRATDLHADLTRTDTDIGFIDFIGPSLPDSWDISQAYSYYTYDYSFGSHSLNLFADIRQSIPEPEDRYDERRNQAYYKGNFDADGVAISGNIRLPTPVLTLDSDYWRFLLLNLDGPNFSTALAGIAGNFDYQAASLDYEVDFVPHDHNGIHDRVLFGAQSTDTRLSIAFDSQRLKFESFAGELINSALDPDRSQKRRNFPDTWTARSVLAYADIPIGRTAKPADYWVGLQAVEILADENMWNRIDPARIWPREPASIELWVAGQVNLFIDLYYPWQAGRLRGGQNAIEVLSARTERAEWGRVFARAALGQMGAVGEFDFDFDHSDTDTFRGFSRPQGSANVELYDLDGLVNRIVEANLFDGLDIRGMRQSMKPFLTVREDRPLAFALEIDPAGNILPGPPPADQ